MLLTTVVVFVLALIPLFFLLWNSFKDASRGEIADFSLGNFSLANFLVAYGSPNILVDLGNTFQFALGSMVVALLLGGSIAFLVERTNTPYRNVIYGLMFMPLILPSMLQAIAWVMLLSPNIGFVNRLWMFLGFGQPLFNVYSMPAMWWVEGLSMSPLAFFMLGASLRAMDPSLEEAAYTAGANRVATLFHITFRLMTPALAATALLLLVRGLETLDVPLILGTRGDIWVYASRIFFALKLLMPPNYSEAYVLSLVLLVLCFFGILTYQRALARSERYVTVTGKGYRPRLVDLGKWRPVAGGGLLFFLFGAYILPFFVFLWVSLLPYLEVPSAEALTRLSLNNYAQLFNRRDVLLMLKNTAILCAVVSLGSMFLALMVSWIVLRLKPRGVRVLDTVAFIPYAIPSIALAFSFMIVFLYIPVGVYGTIWILVLAYLCKFLPMATRFTNSGLAQIHKELEEAASSSGASFVVVLWRILVPLLLPTLVAGGLYIFIISIKVFSIAAVLFSPDTRVLSVFMWELWAGGEVNQLGALAVLMIMILTALTIVVRKLTQRKALVAEVSRKM